MKESTPLAPLSFDDCCAMVRNELHTWFRKQACDPTQSFYCYYLPTNMPHRAIEHTNIVIRTEAPDKDYKLVSNERVDGYATIDRNYTRLYEALRSCNILSPLL